MNWEACRYRGRLGRYLRANPSAIPRKASGDDRYGSQRGSYLPFHCSSPDYVRLPEVALHAERRILRRVMGAVPFEPLMV